MRTVLSRVQFYYMPDYMYILKNIKLYNIDHVDGGVYCERGLWSSEIGPTQFSGRARVISFAAATLGPVVHLAVRFGDKTR